MIKTSFFMMSSVCDNRVTMFLFIYFLVIIFTYCSYYFVITAIMFYRLILTA